MYLSENLRTVIDLWKISRPNIAQLLGVSITKLNSYLKKNPAMPSIEFILKLEDLTGVPARNLFYKNLNKSIFPEKPIKNEENRSIVAEDREEYIITNKDNKQIEQILNAIAALRLRMEEMEEKNRQLEEELTELKKKG